MNGMISSCSTLLTLALRKCNFSVCRDIIKFFGEDQSVLSLIDYKSGDFVTVSEKLQQIFQGMENQSDQSSKEQISKHN